VHRNLTVPSADGELGLASPACLSEYSSGDHYFAGKSNERVLALQAVESCRTWQIIWEWWP
jgi:hypothetical protein